MSDKQPLPDQSDHFTPIVGSENNAHSVAHIRDVQGDLVRGKMEDMTTDIKNGRVRNKEEGVPFKPGLTICREFYEKGVKPIMEADFPEVRYAAGLIGSGSEVLGFDTALSTDHDWRPRVFIFLSDEDREKYGAEIEATIKKKTPPTFQGYITKAGDNVQDPRNRIVYSVNSYFKEYLQRDAQAGMKPIDWLTMPEQRLLSVIKGDVFHDDVGELTAVREKLAYYPRDVWLYLLASQWAKISQEEPFVGRTGDVGDELGSQILAARLVREIMKLCFLMEKQYAPYIKWFGTAFSRLSCAKKLEPIFQKVMHSSSWKEREQHLSEAYEIVAEMHNALAITEPMSTKVTDFHDRPYMVIHGDHFSAEIMKGVQDAKIKSLPMFGSVDQFVDSTDILNDSRLSDRLKGMYGEDSTK